MRLPRRRLLFPFANSMTNENNEKLLDLVSEELDADKIVDYEISNIIPKDVPSITSKDLDEVKIYLPLDYEYSQFVIDNHVRKLGPGLRTKSTRERDLFVMTINDSIDIGQFITLIENIIESEGFCTILKL